MSDSQAQIIKIQSSLLGLYERKESLAAVQRQVDDAIGQHKAELDRLTQLSQQEVDQPEE